MFMWLTEKIRKNKKGFTLIELVIVIAILAILAMLAIPRLGGFQESARIAADEEAANMLANAAKTYAASRNLSSNHTFTVAELSATGVEMVPSNVEFKSTKYKTVPANIDIVFDASAGTATVNGDVAANNPVNKNP